MRLTQYKALLRVSYKNTDSHSPFVTLIAAWVRWSFTQPASSIFRCILFSVSLQICEFAASIEKLLHTHTHALANTYTCWWTHKHIFIHTHIHTHTCTPSHTRERNGSNLQWFMILINFLQVTLLFFLIMIYGHDAQSEPSIE